MPIDQLSAERNEAPNDPHSPLCEAIYKLAAHARGRVHGLLNPEPLPDDFYRRLAESRMRRSGFDVDRERRRRALESKGGHLAVDAQPEAGQLAVGEKEEDQE